MGESSKILLDLEEPNKSSTLESRLVLCKNNKNTDDLLLHSQPTKTTQPPDTKPTISSVLKSQVLGKVKNFLPVMSEANKTLQLAAMDKSKDFDIEALEDNDSAHIEMDLMLGVADLHTPEAIAAAESAINGHQPVFPLAVSDSSDVDDHSDSTDDEEDDDSDSTDEDEDEDDDGDSTDEDEDEEEGDETDTCSPTKLKRTEPAGDESSVVLRNKHSGKRPKIVELS